MHQRELQEVVRSIAIRLSKGASSVIQRMKHSPNNWLCTAGPIFEVSLALEMLGFSRPERSRAWRRSVNGARPPFRAAFLRLHGVQC
jgi:hypothetical protein